MERYEFGADEIAELRAVREECPDCGAELVARPWRLRIAAALAECEDGNVRKIERFFEPIRGAVYDQVTTYVPTRWRRRDVPVSERGRYLWGWPETS